MRHGPCSRVRMSWSCAGRPVGILALVTLTACVPSSNSAPDTPEAGRSAGPDAGEVTPAPVATPPVEPEDLALPTDRALPLGSKDVLRLSDGGDIDVTSAIAARADGSIVLVFDRFDVAFTR